MAARIVETNTFQSDIVIQDWVSSPNNVVEGHTENVRTEGSQEDNRRRPVWTRESTYWLMEEMKQFEMREEKHMIKKRAMYEELAEKFTDANFTIHWEAIQKKWQNLMSTYWRNLKKPKKAGQWEYFTEMDVILRNTTVWVGLNGCKDPSMASSLYYTDQQEDRLWNTERILFLLEEMRQLDSEDDHKGRKSVFYKVSHSFHRLGVEMDWKAIQKKWHNLMSTYKRNWRKPRSEVVWEYYDAMDSVARKLSAVYRRMGVPGTSEFGPTLYEVTKVESAEESLWSHDNTLWLLEEMYAVKERRDKHHLKNRVVFREIADTFNAENFLVDWKQVLKKWQTMYIIYSKIMRRVMQPGQWQYFERMHDIVGDTDMYVGVGAKKPDNQAASEPVVAEETVYHYINPEDNSQFVLTSSQTINNGVIESKPLDADNKVTQQYFEYVPETKTYRPVQLKDEALDSDQLVATEYVVATNTVNTDEDDAQHFTLEFQDGDHFDGTTLEPGGNVIESTISVQSLINARRKSKSLNCVKSYNCGRDLNCSDLAADLEHVISSNSLVLSESLLGNGVVMEDGVVFEEHVQTNDLICQDFIEIEMDDIESDLEEKVLENMDCDGTIESIVEDTISIDGIKFEEEALLEISEVGFHNENTSNYGTNEIVAKCVDVKDQSKSISFIKDKQRKRKMFQQKSSPDINRQKYKNSSKIIL